MSWPLLMWVDLLCAAGELTLLEPCYRDGQSCAGMENLARSPHYVDVLYKNITFSRAHRVEGENFVPEDFCYFRAIFTSTLIALSDVSLFSVNGITWLSCHLSITVSIAQKWAAAMLHISVSQEKRGAQKYGKYFPFSFSLTLHTKPLHVLQNTHDFCVDILLLSNNLLLSQGNFQYFISLCKEC